MTFPTGSCDTHIHVYDDRYAVAPSAVLRPPNASLANYQLVQRAFGLQRVVLVQPTTYGLDNSCQLAAMADLGDDARAVVVVDDKTSRDELERLTNLGARGARFHMLPGGAVGWDIMQTVSDRIAEFGWHIQLQMNGRELPERLDGLLALGVPLVVDHVGRFMPPVATTHKGFDALRTLVDTGRCWVKLSAPYESTKQGAPHYPAVTNLVRTLLEHAPERMLWATNWPHPGQDPSPTVGDIQILADEWLGDTAMQQCVLVDNPANLYQFPTIDQETS